MTVKAEQPTADEVRRLAEMDTQFVSLVPRGANRQSKFFVVKADGTQAPAEEELKIDEPLQPAADAAAADEKDAQATGTPSAPENPDVDPAPAAASKLDLAPWLETAGARIQSLVMDMAINRALEPSQPEPEARAASSDTAPPDEHGQAQSAAEIAALKADLSASVARVASLEAEIREQRAAAEKARADAAAGVAKAQSALAVERARVVKLRGSIARPSALPTGEVPAGGNAAPARVCWAGDLAKQVREEERQPND